MDGEVSLLEREYCPPIDTALFYAIVSDFDLKDPVLLQSARSTLDAIRTSAEGQEDTTFDPSGSTNVQDGTGAYASLENAPSWNGDVLSETGGTGATSLTASMKPFELDERSSVSTSSQSDVYDFGIENLPTADKLAILAESFPDMKPFDISRTLAQCRDNVEKAIDELLNQAFFAEGLDSDGEQHIIPRGVEGFAAWESSQRKRKGKGKKRKHIVVDQRSRFIPASREEETPSLPNKWNVAKKEIEFIEQRTHLSIATVTSTYHKSGGSLRATIGSICESELGHRYDIGAEDAVIQFNASQLGLGFPSIPPLQLIGLVKLTHPSTASAHELANAVVSSPVGADTFDGTSLIPQYTRPNIFEDSPALPFTTVQRTKREDRLLGADMSDASSLAAAYGAARTAAFAQATAAYRKSRSNPLMGGAASYYASVGRDAKASAHAYSAVAADALVARQSSFNEIDLHGIDVRNAMRISCEKTHSWWDSGRSEWAREGKVMGDGGFRIITGAGKHSQGGKGILGPAVRKTLIQEGWRINEAKGVLTVIGRARR